MNEASLCEQDNDCPHSDSERMHSCICNGSRSVLLSCDKQNVLHKIKDNFVIKPCGYYIGKCVSYQSPHDLAEAHKKEEKKTPTCMIHPDGSVPSQSTVFSIFNPVIKQTLRAMHTFVCLLLRCPTPGVGIELLSVRR